MTERGPKVIVVDHRDSFVFILAEQFLRLGAAVDIYRSDELDAGAFGALVETEDPDLVVLSPGPGHPDDAGVSVPWLMTSPSVPVLGVCLGHQAIAVAAGGTVSRAPTPVHGQASRVRFEDDPLFADLPATAPVGRYHSLVASELPSILRVIATLDDGGEPLVMALRHRELPQIGLQFHPESVLTPNGGPLIHRVLREAVDRRPAPGGETS